MHLLKTLLAACACLAHVSLANPVVAFTKWPGVVYTGKPSSVYWEGDDKAPATITLRKGPSGNLQTVKVLTTQARGGAFIWTPDASLVDGADYALQIDQNGQINYSGLLTLAHTPGKEPVAQASNSGPVSSETSPYSSMRTSTGKSNDSGRNSSSSRLNMASTKGPVSVETLTGDASFSHVSTKLFLGAVGFVVCLVA